MIEPIAKRRPHGHSAKPRSGPCRRFKFLTTPTCLSLAPPRVQGFLIHNNVLGSAGMRSHPQVLDKPPCPRTAHSSDKLRVMRFVYDKIAARPKFSPSEPEQDKRYGGLTVQSISALGAVSKTHIVYTWLQHSQNFTASLTGTTSPDHRAVAAPQSSTASCGCDFYQCCMHCSPQKVAALERFTLHRPSMATKSFAVCVAC